MKRWLVWMVVMALGVSAFWVGHVLADVSDFTVWAPDDNPILYGDDQDFQVDLDTGTGKLTVRDADGNALWTLTDAGTTATVTVDTVSSDVENMTTSGGAGTAPMSDGSNGLDMTDVTTQAEFDARIPVGTVASRTLRWSGTAWVESAALVNDGTDVSITGKLGVGTAALTTKLHVYKSDAVADTSDGGFTVEQASTGDAAIDLFLSGVTRWRIGIDNSDGDSLKIRPGFNLSTSATGITILKTGSVGIGTAAPGAMLDVRGGAIFNEDSADVDFRVEADTNAYALFVDGTGSGLVGIGTAGPDRKLDVLDSTNPQIRLSQADGTAYAELRADSNGILALTSHNTSYNAVNIGQSDTVKGVLSLYGHGAANVAGGVIDLYTAADHDTTINYYELNVSSDDLLLGPNTDLDSLEYDGGLNIWSFTASDVGVRTATPSAVLDVVGDIEYTLNSIATDVSDGLGLAEETEGSSTGEQNKLGAGYTQVWSNAVVVNNARAMFVVEYETYCLEDDPATKGYVRISLATTTGGTANADGVTFVAGTWSDSGTMRALDTAVNTIIADAWEKHRAVILPLGLSAGSTYYVNIDIQGEDDGTDKSRTYIRNMYTKVNQ